MQDMACRDLRDEQASGPNDAPLAQLPRFIREGGLFVTGDLHRGNRRRWQRKTSQQRVRGYRASRSGTAEFLRHAPSYW